MRVESHVTSLSWIPSEAVTGLMRTAFAVGVSHYDEPPPEVIEDLEALRVGDGYRFGNTLSAWAAFAEDGTLVGHDVSGGVSMGATTVRIGPLGATFAAVPMPELRAMPEIGDGWVKFTQTAGGRTALPLPRRIAKAPFVRLQSPLVWTTLSLTLYADGHAESSLDGASPFPRHWIYDAQDRLSHKAGVTDWQKWVGQPSWQRTPWGDEESPVLVTAVETALERELSTVIMRGGKRPNIRTAAAGETVVRQGDAGDSLFLLLDGILTVDVDGKAIAELGPGAVFGERALFEGGRRTSTLTAMTPVRIAEAAADTIDIAALSALSEGHRREETTA
jgi:cyclic nucleotide-binding protein